MSINSWLYDKIISSSNINSVISSRCYPSYAPSTASSLVPYIVYNDLSQKNNLLCRQPIISIRCMEKTMTKCETLNEYIYKLFDNTTTKISEMSSSIRIEGVEIVNNIPSIYDFTNNIWNGILDIRIFYEK